MQNFEQCPSPLGPSPLALAAPIDCASEARRIETFLVEKTVHRLRRRGLVVGVSGGLDSAVCATLAARAVGSDRVLALLMPESESSPAGTERAQRLCEGLGIRFVIEDITGALEAIGCYRRRDDAIRRLYPAYGPGWRHKIVISGSGDGRLPSFDIVVEDKDANRSSLRMPTDVYLMVVAATNFKQRIRKSVEYHHAESLNYAVLGTPNRLEYELGFFVRGGDGLADLKPVAHLFKTQVFAMARFLGVPEEIIGQTPTTDTYSLPQTQEEFYFTLPFDKADRLLDAMTRGIGPDEAGPALGLSGQQAKNFYRDFTGKRRVAARNSGDAFTLAAT